MTLGKSCLHPHQSRCFSKPCALILPELSGGRGDEEDCAVGMILSPRRPREGCVNALALLLDAQA
eukprot:995483-Pyramimonas_sp.AAC.1